MIRGSKENVYFEQKFRKFQHSIEHEKHSFESAPPRELKSLWYFEHSQKTSIAQIIPEF